MSLLRMYNYIAILIIIVGMLVTGCSSPTSDQKQVAQSQGSGSGILLKDSFTEPPVEPWHWIRENPQAHRSTPQGLEIMLEPGGLMGAGRDARNILIRPLPENTKAISVKVDANHESQYEQAGLILYRGDDDYIKLVKEYVDGVTWIVMVPEVEAKTLTVVKVPCPAPDAWICLQFDDDGRVRGLCWGQDNTPIVVSMTEFPLSPAPSIGVFTQSGQPNADRWARFSDFTISSATLPGSK